MGDARSKGGRLRYAASCVNENFVIYLGNGAQDSGSPTCAPAPVTWQCDYGRRRTKSGGAKTSTGIFDGSVSDERCLLTLSIEGNSSIALSSSPFIHLSTSELRSELREETLAQRALAEMG